MLGGGGVDEQALRTLKSAAASGALGVALLQQLAPSLIAKRPSPSVATGEADAAWARLTGAVAGQLWARLTGAAGRVALLPALTALVATCEAPHMGCPFPTHLTPPPLFFFTDCTAKSAGPPL